MRPTSGARAQVPFCAGSGAYLLTPSPSRLVIGSDFFNTMSTIVDGRLGNVIYIVAFTERTRLRTFAYGWHYRKCEYYDQAATFGYTDQFGR